MNQNQTESTPPSVEESADKGLDGTPCSRSFLEMRWYDKQWDKWTEWEEVEGFKLREKYGTTPEEWKASCEMWIEVGGHYEFRIGTRTDVVNWKISYRENVDVVAPPPMESDRSETGKLMSGCSPTSCSLLFGDLVLISRTITADGRIVELPKLYKKLLTAEAHKAQREIEEDIPLMLTSILRAVPELDIPVRWPKHLAAASAVEPGIRDLDA